MTAKETITESPVGAGLLAKREYQSTSMLTDPPLSRASRIAASPLPQVSGPTLDFAEVSLTLGRTTILDKVTFQVRPGSVHALVGPNGGGKSSLIKTLLGQMPHQGRLSLQWPGEPGTIGYVPQALEFDRGLPMTVDDFMAAMCQRRPAFLGLSKHYAAAMKSSTVIGKPRSNSSA